MYEPSAADGTGPSGHSAIRDWRLRLGAAFWLILGLGFLLSLPVIYDWAAWAFVVILVAAGLLAVPVAWIKGVIFARRGKRSFKWRWLRSSVTWFLLLCILVAAPIYYLATLTETKPALVPQATLTNGQKTVVFQGMQHIGSEHFYKSVIYDLEQAIADGAVIYYEDVQTKTPESKAFFAKLTGALVGGSDLSGAYRLIGETCGLKFQLDYFGLLDADKREHPERHLIADVDAIELKQEYERLMRTDPAFAAAHADDFSAGQPADGSSDALLQALQWMRSGSDSQKRLAGVVCRGLMTLTREPGDGEGAGRFDPIILDFRNRALAERIVADQHARIFITYGARHLPGVFAELRQRDPNWKLVSVKWMRMIEAPTLELEGKLAL